MKKIVLKKNLENAGKFYAEGEEVELDDVTYEWLVQSYLAERTELIKLSDETLAKSEEHIKELENIKTMKLLRKRAE